MPRIIPGNTITSPHVDANRAYVDGRSIAHLAAVGALQPIEQEVLARVDGIVDNRPANDRPEVDELVRMEQPPYAATLFPAERAAQPGLWKLLEWRATPAAAPAVELPALAAVDRSTSPDALDYGLQVRISTLPQALRTTARRVQLVLDGDGAATTISMADTAAAIAAPGRFTPGDLADCRAIADEIAARVRQQQAALAATVEVPAPGVTTTDLGTAAGIAFRATTTTTIEETRTIQPNEHSSRWQVAIEAHIARAATIEVPADCHAILFDAGSGETLLPAGTHDLALAEGTYRVERWKNGRKQAVGEIALPAIEDARLDLRAFAGHAFVDPQGAALHRNVVEARWVANNYGSAHHVARFRYEAAAAAPPANVDQASLAAVATPHVTLAPGRYQVDPRVTVDVFPGDVLKVTIDGTTTPLLPQQLDRQKKFDNTTRGPGGVRAWFDPTRNHIYVGDGRPFVDAVITDGMRVG